MELEVHKRAFTHCAPLADEQTNKQLKIRTTKNILQTNNIVDEANMCYNETT